MSGLSFPITEKILKTFLNLKDQYHLYDVWFITVPNVVGGKNIEMRSKLKFQCPECSHIDIVKPVEKKKRRMKF